MSEPRAVVTMADLEAVHGTGNAAAQFNRIAQIGGFGRFDGDYNGGYPALALDGLKADQLAEIETMFAKPAPKSPKDGK